VNAPIAIAPVFGRSYERRQCPFCGHATRKPFLVWDSGGYYCHWCKVRGRIARDTVPYQPVGRIVNDDGLRLERVRAMWAETTPLLAPEAERARDYFRHRGLNVRTVQGLDVAYVNRWPSPRIGPALAFAFRDQQGEVVAVQGRAITPNVFCPHPAAGLKRLGVFATTSAFDVCPFAITEAPIDAVSLLVVGVKAVATGGTTYPAWLPHALRSSRRILVATDADDAGDAFGNGARNLNR
jgi:hypothetical protein